MKPFIIPVFIPHSGCPHQCAFCNQKAISGQTTEKMATRNVQEQIDRFLSFPRDEGRPVQISFYGGNFLGLSRSTMLAFLDLAHGFIKQGDVDGIRFSTRPDTISRASLALLREYPVQTVEIGVQSMDDHVLAVSRRGHSANDTEIAVQLLNTTPYEIGLQMMIGLPGDADAPAQMTARKIASFAPDFVRIYPAVVLKGSPMAAWYAQGRYTPLTLDAAVEQVKGLYLFFQDQSIPVIRMGLQASDELNSENTVLAGPYHPAFGHLVMSSVWLDKASELLASENIRGQRALLYVRPENISNMRGQRNGNIIKLMERFQLRAVDVKPDEKLIGEAIRLQCVRAPDR
jgi:histone acetyltransferase (RNA polymerase elongator complex component)